jgi:hypothetical protein
MKYRREVPRNAAGWPGICNIAGDSAEWSKCTVVDISMLGLALALEHPSPSTLTGRRISLYVPVQLVGEVTNAGRTLEDGVRVGIKFDDGLFADSDAEIAALLQSTIGELNGTGGRHIRR